MIPCPFITAGHPFEPAIDRIRKVLADQSGPADRADAKRRAVRQHELKGLRDASGAWRMDRFYSSVHSWDSSSPVPFNAVTYLYSDAQNAGEWFQFPREPYLVALEHLVQAEQPEVLQYVVLRRLTYRARTASGAAYIGKFKRRSRARGAFDALTLVSAAAREHPLSFRIPAPLSYDGTRHLFHQEAMPGRPVNELIDQRTLEPFLFGVGRVHAELHQLAVPALPAADDRSRVDALSRNCDWIAFFRPWDRARLDAVRDVLLDAAPRLAPAELATCHGDLVCSHVLYGFDGWAVVDFDLARRDDPNADGAVLLSSLTNDVPLLHGAWRDPAGAPEVLLDRAISAYVEGYQSYGAQALDRRRLLWHRIAAEIHMLGLMFTKDRFHGLAFQRSLALVERLTSELSRAAGGAA